MKKILNKLHQFFIPSDRNNHHPHFFKSKSFTVLILLVIMFELAFLIQTLFIFNKTNFLAAVLPGILTSLTNEQRLANNVNPLTENPILVSAAQLKANDMAEKGYFSHNTPDGKTPWYFLEQAGYKYSVAGENLAINFFESIDVANAWMASPSHRANIVKKEYTEIGIATASGIYEGRSAVFVVQFFGKPANKEIVVNNTTNNDLVVNTNTQLSVLGDTQKNTINQNPKVSKTKVAQKVEIKTEIPVQKEDAENKIINAEKDLNILGDIKNQEVFKNVNNLNNAFWIKLKNEINLFLINPNKIINNTLLLLLAFIGFVFILYTILTKISHSFIFVRTLVLSTLIFVFMFMNLNLSKQTTQILDQKTSFISIAL